MAAPSHEWSPAEIFFMNFDSTMSLLFNVISGTRYSAASIVDVELATFEWVNWWSETRFHQSLGYCTPAEGESGLWENPTYE